MSFFQRSELRFGGVLKQKFCWSDKIRAGICEWGYVEGREKLVNDNNERDPDTAFNYVRYKVRGTWHNQFIVTGNPADRNSASKS